MQHDKYLYFSLWEVRTCTNSRTGKQFIYKNHCICGAEFPYMYCIELDTMHTIFTWFVMSPDYPHVTWPWYCSRGLFITNATNDWLWLLLAMGSLIKTNKKVHKIYCEWEIAFKQQCHFQYSVQNMSRYTRGVFHKD